MPAPPQQSDPRSRKPPQTNHDPDRALASGATEGRLIEDGAGGGALLNEDDGIPGAKPTADSGPQDALALLSSHHQLVEAAFSEYLLAATATASAADRQGLIARIAIRLRAHGTVEEEVFYPPLRHAGLPDVVLQAAVEDHAQVLERLQQLAQAQAASESEIHILDAQVHALHDQVRRHAADEETRFFGAARRLGLDLHALGTQMALRHGALLGNDAGVD